MVAQFSIRVTSEFIFVKRETICGFGTLRWFRSGFSVDITPNQCHLSMHQVLNFGPVHDEASQSLQEGLADTGPIWDR